MTDAEMVKAMEICKDKEIPCDDCPLVKCGDCEEISRQYFYDRFNQLKSENAALRERLEKAIETPCEDGDVFYRFFWHPNEMVEDMACGFRKEKDGEIYVCSAYSESWDNIKDCEFSLKAAKARLKRMQKKVARRLGQMLIQSFSQYVQFWESMGVEPLKIIEKYLVESKQEQAALEMIPRLAESQTNRVQRQLDYARTWIPIKVDTFACNKGLTHEQAQMLNTLTDYYCLGLELSEDYLEKVRVVIPQIKKPLLVFIPMVEWLKETYGIKFKGEK